MADCARQAESNPGPLAWQASTLPVRQRGNLIGKASTYTDCSMSLCYILPCQISVRPRTPGTVSAVRVLTTTQLLYNIESPHREDSHSFFHLSLFGEATVTLIKEPFPTSLLSYNYDYSRARRQSGFPTFISCQRQDANMLPKRRQSHQGDKLCDVSTVPLVARWPVFLARGSDTDGEPHTAPVQTVLPSCDHYSTHVQTLLPSGGPISGAIVTVADCAGRPSRTRDLSLGRRVRYQFAKEVTSLARPVHTLTAQRHSDT